MTPEVLKQQLAAAAEQINQVIKDDLAAVTNPRLAAILEHALLAGGKRIRPLLTLLAAQLVQGHKGTENPQAGTATPWQQLAISFEYLHTASLLHDDVIDHAALRRGRETVNTRWDNGSAILAGDFLHARALLLAGRAGGVPCLELIGTATQAMVDSEFIQQEAAASRDWREETYFAVLDGKTAALIAAACEAGGVAAGGNPAQRRALHTYGGNLGRAFQIIDDLLDYLGEPGATGKAVGNDLQEGKMTLPLLIARQRASAEQQAELEAIITAPAQRRREQFTRVRTLLEQTGALAACRQRAEELIAAGDQALAVFAATPQRDLLHALGQYVLQRDR
ncbi:polyprenyl synthetase family protein [Desulfurivibrio alkaliphilus]|uniref:Trans-hexaprenyltranstransferase n=1 Tax=Desulfurivibrio alkaliphilus (strain DSM 19089 / UNIQEM U267 / AHT2) TaxID=589865 RepID=D6Z6D9_DESAT|nr:polyprenyl synthetase family protein [Desulfurivibrio alkaliphilus]ADH86904.1 Trans-hexaprenyltranstransferase [Desulfurivibrio alkaliphilus AHT 2]